ncbi:hypothetical protein E4U21_006139 [Claviceps maximensis]|nr:hypothetical protein E4U21_006139 [Claviceps maximensis]
MQWLICHILRADYTFVQLVTRVLRLTRMQIQNFLIEYMTEYNVWIRYEENVSSIPWRQLVLHAADSKLTVAELVHVYRPDLPTDVISREGIARAAQFLHARGLGTYAAGLDGWFGIGRMDFLDLNVCRALVRDTLDRNAISKAAEWGWIDVDEVVQRARRRARRLMLQADAACPVAGRHLDEPWRTTTTTTMTTTTEVREPQTARVDCGRDGVHVTPRCNRTVWSGIVENVMEVAPVSLMSQGDLPIAGISRGNADSKNRWQDKPYEDKRPNIKARGASRAQIDEIRLSLTRQMPVLLPRHVPGSLVVTAEERARAAQKSNLISTSTTTSSRLPRTLSTPTPTPTPTPTLTSAPKLTSTSPRRKAKTTNLRKAATSRASQARGSPPGPGRVLDYLFDSPDTCQLLAAAAAAGDGVLNASQGARWSSQVSRTQDARGHYQDLSVSVPGDGDLDRDEPLEAPASHTRDTQVTPDLSNVEYHASTRGEFDLPATQACSAELRKALDSTFSDYLRPENTSSTPVKRKRSMSLLDVLEAQDDDDADYIPIKATATKRRQAAQSENSKTAKPNRGEQLLQRSVKNRRVSAQQVFPAPSGAIASDTQTTTSGLTMKKERAAKQPRVGGVDADDNPESEHVPTGQRKDHAVAVAVANNGSDDKPSRAEPVKTKKNTDPIFGIPRNQELCRPLERAEDVEYAWSADTAEFAMVCGRAKYALKADRVRPNLEQDQDKDGEKGDQKTKGREDEEEEEKKNKKEKEAKREEKRDNKKKKEKEQEQDKESKKDEETEKEQDKENEKGADAAHVRQALYTLKKLQTRFGLVEATQRSFAAQDAERARFAGCADRAMYAADAEEADSHFIINRGGCDVGACGEFQCYTESGYRRNDAKVPASIIILAGIRLYRVVEPMRQPVLAAPDGSSRTGTSREQSVSSSKTRVDLPSSPSTIIFPRRSPPNLVMSSKIRDKVYLPLIGVQLLGTLLLDIVPLLPKALCQPPSSPLHGLLSLRTWWATYSGDPYFASLTPEAWFHGFLYVEAFVQLPLMVYLVARLSAKTTSGPTEMAGLVYGCITFMGSLACCFDIWHMGPERVGAEHWGKLFWGTYLPFCVIRE